MPKSSFVVELRPDRNLLDPSFEGYKLCLDTVPVYTKSIPEGVDFKQPDDDQFSFQHVKLFSLQNHLHVNPFTNAMYFVDKKWNVTKVVLNLLNKLESLDVVWKIPGLEVHRKKLYNVSLAFASSDTVVLSDGAGTAHIVQISMNENMETWNVVSSVVPCENESGFLLSNAHLAIDETAKELHIILMHVEQKNDKEKEVIASGLFHTIIEWVTLIQNEAQSWIKKSHKNLEVNGNVEYTALEPGAKAMFIVSDTVPKWTFDSEKDIIQEKYMEPADIATQEKLYTWMQTEEDITVSMKTADDVKKSNLIVTVDSTYLKVKIKGEEVLSGEFFRRIDKDLTSWTLEKNKLEIHLMKQDSDQMWQELLVNDKRGEQVYDPELVGRIHDQLAHLCSDKEVDSSQPAFNTQQLEECDSTSCDTVFVRMSPENHSITHEISLSSFQWLFKVQHDPKKTPAICLRHDVDACVWQFQESRDDDKNWPYTHVGTFFAFGYVQASKDKKKYLTSPPDLSYAIICETSRHIYLYRQPSTVSGQLRNRSTGRRVETVSKQQLINLDTNEQILGVHATNSLLYVLTDNIIHVLTINE